MTVVFVHGVPDTARVWDRLVARLAPEGVKLALPGFDRETPQGFTASKEDYVSWLIGALEAVPAPRDVIAHDWGSILLMRVLTLRPDLVRTWVGGGAPLTADYTWHATARLWQTPGAGEKVMQRLTPGIAADMLMKAGLAEGDAAETARHIDQRMRDCILALYRSGRHVFREWGPALGRVAAPGLVMWGERDAYAEAVFADRLGAVTGAKVVRLDCGHWWQVERPDAAAAAISTFWREAGV
ncbi:MAG: alpha/beta fold hydrolase [Hyphomicrobium sp.]|uniref:alpha/beta fold hydrolase n=1 Tax=Hyphomicrobium sp. TaxID=82 RepID=UPI003D13A8BD